MQILFDNLKRNKFLKIIKENRKAQQKLNIRIKDYKEYSELYSPIELEIMPTEGILEKFINYKQKEESYYHKYLNYNKIKTKKK